MISPWFAAHPKKVFALYLAMFVILGSAAIIGTVTSTMSLKVASFLLGLIVPCLILCMAGSNIECWFFDRLTRRYTRVKDQRVQLTLSDRGVNGIGFYRFRPGIREWCQDNLVGWYGILPQPENKDERIIWFSNPHDAMHFKLRWL